MQNYDSAPSRNNSAKDGVKPAKISVPMPGTNAKPARDCVPGSKVKAPAGFTGGLISGKV